jgi:hypothetical protein
LLSLNWIASSQEPKSGMTFFITSAGSGKGADLGGLAGADKQCQALARAAGAGDRTWRAYLSTSAAEGKPAVNARDRIGKGPWQNAKGVVIAKSVDELHGDPNINKETGLSEKGERINVAATSRTCTIFSPAHSRMGARLQETRIAPVATGRAATKGQPWLDTTTAWACATTKPHVRGIPHIRPAAAVRTRCAVRAATVWFTVSRRSSGSELPS